MSATQGSIPDQGPERQIFVNALREYRNACEAPELTPDCPFFTWTSNGPACGEQCADILAFYGDEEEEERVDLGGGIVVRREPSRRRPRLSPNHPIRPFDARQVYLDDDHRPHADRRTVALIVELAELISVPPSQAPDPTERAYDVDAAIEQLRARGIDVEALVRYGIGGVLPMHFLVHILLPIIAESGDSPAIVKPAKLGEVPQAPEGWAKFFKDCYAGDVREPSGDYATLEYALHGFLDQIRRWLGKAPLADIISWHAPDYPLAELSADPPDADDRDARNVARWMFDRFMVASVQEWQLPSLHSEWLYIHGRIPAPCSTTSMAERRLSPQEISNEIAQRTSQDWRRGSTREGKSDLASSFISVAADHLRNGRSEFAAAIFEAVLSLSPNDEDARNNYAFCLMPVDPVNAMAELEKLNESAHPTLTTLANRVLALHLLGRDEAALALGKSEEAQNLPSLSGLMWLVDADHALRLSDWVDTRRYLLTLLDHIDKDCKAGVVDAGADGPTGTFLVLSTGRDG